MTKPLRLSRRRSLALLASSVLLSCGDNRIAPRKDEADLLLKLSATGADPKLIRIGVTPSRGPTTHKFLQPLFDYLETQLTPRTVQGVTASSYDELASLVRSGDIELGVFSPAAYVKARSSLPAVPVATMTRNGSPTYLGYIVTSRRTPRPTLADLKGKTIAWVNKASTSGYIYPRAMLRSKGIDPNTFFSKQILAGNHEDSLRRLLSGDVDCAAVASPFVDPDTNTTFPEAPEKLIVVTKTKRIPCDCVVVHERLQRQLAKNLQQALLQVVYDEEHRTSAKLDKSWGLDGFVKPMHDRYDEIEQVRALSG